MANSECLCLEATTAPPSATLLAIRDSLGGTQAQVLPQPFLVQCRLPLGGMALTRLGEQVVVPTLQAHRRPGNRALAVSAVLLLALVVLALLLGFPFPSTMVSM